jgi:hypothetical protein
VRLEEVEIVSISKIMETAMDKLTIRILAVISILMISGPVIAVDGADAQKAATEIRASIKEGKFELLWETQTSNYFKKAMKKDAFIANMTIGKAQVGPQKESKYIDVAIRRDPSTGFDGDIYVFTYSATYSGGKLFEQLSLIKEDDKFKMYGLWATPAQ